MRNAVMILVNAILGILVIVSVMTIAGRMNRSVELQSSLSSSMEKTVEEAVAQQSSSGNSEEAIALCIKNLAIALDTDSNLTVEIMKADEKKGVLAIRAIEKFRYPNGKIGTTEWERTAILNRVAKPEINQYKVRFYKTREDMLAEENCYKAYTVQEGDRLAAPVFPTDMQGVFYEWKDINDYMADFSLPVTQNQVYYAGAW